MDLLVFEVDKNIQSSAFLRSWQRSWSSGLKPSLLKYLVTFVPDSEKVIAGSYQAFLRQHVMPWFSATYPEGNYMFQQDGAPRYIANSIQRSVGIRVSSGIPFFKNPAN
jgi:hypothetical protein